MGLNLKARGLCAGHNAAKVVDAAGVVGSNSVGVASMVGVGGVGDGGNGSRGSSSLHLNLGGNGTGSQVRVGAVGVRVAGVGDGRCGNGHGGNNGLLMDVGNGNIAGGVMDVRLSSRGSVISDITGGIMDIGKSCRGIIDSDIASGVVDVGKSHGGLSALLRDGAGKSHSNGGQENLSKAFLIDDCFLDF